MKNSKRKTRSDKFPLTLHPTGQYCKKIKGRIRYFGTDKKQALERYLGQATYLHGCQRSMQIASNGKMMLKELCDVYLQYQHSRVLADELPSPLAVLHDYGGQYYPDKRIAIDIAPLIVLLLIVGGLFGYRQYHRYQIMTSEAGQAIKSFLDIVTKTSDEFPELKKPEPASPAPDDQTILKPFDNIEPIRED